MAANVLMQLMLDIRQLQSALHQAQASMQTATANMGRQVNRAGREMQASGKKATGFANAIDFIKKRVIVAGLFFAGFYQGLILFRQFVGEVVGEFFNLDDALRRVQSITKQTDESIGRLREQLLGAAKNGELFDQTASDVADSMFTIAQAGFSVNESLILAKLAAEGAAVGFTTAEVAAKVLVNVLKAYDLPVSAAREVMDIMFQTVDTGVLTFEDLSTNLGRVLASASALNVPLTDITGTVATLTLRGFTAAQAMTSVNRILQTFIRPSNRAKDAAADLGIELNRDTIAAKGLVPILNEMWIAAGKDANVFADMFDRIQSTRGALSLMTDDGVLLTRVMEDMGTATADAGAMALALEQRAKSLKFQMAILRSQFLSVVTNALTPFTGALARVIQQLNKILSGQNAVFNFFGDLKSLVLAATAAFLFMQRTAIASIFTGIASALVGFVTIMRVSVAEVGVLGTAVRGLSGVLAKFGPMLLFLAVFALAKFAGQFDPLAKATNRARERIVEFNEALAMQQQLMEEGIITPEEFGVRAWESAIDTIATIVREDFEPAMEAAQLRFSSFGNGVATVAGGIKRAITGDFRDAAQVVRDDFNKTLEEMVQNLKDAGASSGEIEEVAKQMRILAATSEDADLRDLFGQAAIEVQTMANNAAEVESRLVDAAQAGDGLNKLFGNTVITAGKITEGIEKWIDPIQKAKDLTEEILGLSNQQDIVYRTLIEPIEDRIALRNVAIADAKTQQFERAEDLGIAIADIEDSEEEILALLQDGVVELEGQIEVDENLIEKLETRLELQIELGETQAAANVLLDLQNGKFDQLTGELLPEQIRLLDQVVHDFLPRGGEGISDWVTLTEAMGKKLDEDVLGALLLIIDGLNDNELSLEVNQALVNLGLVEKEAERISNRSFHIRFTQELRARERGLQQGIRNFMGGLALVGEAGPELVRLPRGVDVVPHGNIGHELRGQSRQLAPNITLNAEANITTSLLKDFMSLKAEVLRAMDEKLDEAAVRAGLAKPRSGTWGAGLPRV